MLDPTTRIAVLMGGTSSERAISLKSGKGVSRALREGGYHVEEIDVGPDIGDRLRTFDCDVAFIALHGEFGEDGGIQTLLAARGIPYTGSGPLSSRIAMDKTASKIAFADARVPAPTSWTLSRSASQGDWRRALRAIGAPAVVKPAADGSSVGVAIVDSEASLKHGVALAGEFGEQIMIERFLGGRELTVGILDGAALPIVEVVYPGLLFDFKSKYSAGQTDYIIDPELDGPLKRRVQAMAVQAHRALGCRDFSRVDFRLDDGGVPYVLEVNTIPGLTATSLLPKAARAVGIEFLALCERMIESTLRARCGRGVVGVVKEAG